MDSAGTAQGRVDTGSVGSWGARVGLKLGRDIGEEGQVAAGRSDVWVGVLRQLGDLLPVG